METKSKAKTGTQCGLENSKGKQKGHLANKKQK